MNAQAIFAARERLRVALLEGKDTTICRQAIAKLEQAARAVREREADVARDVNRQRAIVAQERGAEIAAQVQARIADMLAQFPIPLTDSQKQK